MLYQAVLNLVLSKKPRSGNHANESYLNNLIFLSFIEVPFSQPFETSLRFELKSVGITRGVKFLQMGASIRSFFHATFSLFVTPDATVKTHVYEPYFFKLISIGFYIIVVYCENQATKVLNQVINFCLKKNYIHGCGFYIGSFTHFALKRRSQSQRK